MGEKGNAMVSESQFKFLRSIDTPTICNLIEIVAPERRGIGYTASHLHCPFPDLPPMVGFAKTATIRARDHVLGITIPLQPIPIIVWRKRARVVGGSM